MDKEALILGGVAAAVGVVAIVVSKGGVSTNGVSFSQADPQSVAAMENGIVAEQTANNNLLAEKMKIASDTILGLTTAQQALQLGQINASTAIEETRLTTAAQTQQASITASATQAAAQIVAQMQESIASTQAGAQEAIAANQTTQAQAAAGAQKTSSFYNMLGSIAGTVVSVFKHL